jgi:hypothetical protein
MTMPGEVHIAMGLAGQHSGYSLLIEIFKSLQHLTFKVSSYPIIIQ